MKCVGALSRDYSWCFEVSGICVFFFFFQAEDGIRDVAVTGVQTCALPISSSGRRLPEFRTDWYPSSARAATQMPNRRACPRSSAIANFLQHGLACSSEPPRSEEHTSELQSRLHLVCRLLLEKKKKKNIQYLDTLDRIID